MSNEPNKPIPAQELSEEELAGVVGGGVNRGYGCMEPAVIPTEELANIEKNCA